MTRKISEAHIQQTCSEWLQLDEWRRIRTDMKQLRGMGVQEKGMADDLFIRYVVDVSGAVRILREAGLTAFQIDELTAHEGAAQILWCEWKAKKGVHGVKQREWQALERARGALVWVAQQDFPATIEGFQEHYRKSGLRRNASL